MASYSGNRHLDAPQMFAEFAQNLQHRCQKAQAFASNTLDSVLKFVEHHNHKNNNNRNNYKAIGRITFPAPFASVNAAPAKVTTIEKKEKLQPRHSSTGEDDRVLISEVVVEGAAGDMLKAAMAAITTRPHFTTSLREVQADVQRVFATGWFKEVTPDAEDTRDGVKLIIKVEPNPPFRAIRCKGADRLPTSVVQKAFRRMYGHPFNYVHFGRGVQQLDTWYQDRGLLGQVVDLEFDDGVAQLECGEAIVGKVELNWGQPPEGEPKGPSRVRPEIVTREMATRSGRMYSLKEAKRDISAVFATGLFSDVNIVPKEAEESTEMKPKVDLAVNLVPRRTGGLSAGTGLSASIHGEGAVPGFMGSASYNERNFLGLGQRLSALAEIGQVDKIFRIQHLDPWVNTDPHRTSRTIQLMNTRISGATIVSRPEGDADESIRATGQGVVFGRLSGSVAYRRPLSSAWTGEATLALGRVTCLGEDGVPVQEDDLARPLTISGGLYDLEATANVSATYNPQGSATQGVLAFSQGVAPEKTWINFSRLTGRVEVPIDLGVAGAQLITRARMGLTAGDVPPYQAFAMGGTNSVRGYAEGGLGTGRHMVEGGVEVRVPLWKRSVGGCIFLDGASDLDSGRTVLGDPGGARGKPGKGYGYGCGLRVDSPLGTVRFEYAWNKETIGRFHLGLGYE